MHVLVFVVDNWPVQWCFHWLHQLLSDLIHLVGLVIDEICFASVGHLKHVSFLSLNVNVCGCVLFHLPVSALVWPLLLVENGLVCLESVSVRLLHLLVVGWSMDLFLLIMEECCWLINGFISAGSGGDGWDRNSSTLLFSSCNAVVMWEKAVMNDKIYLRINFLVLCVIYCRLKRLFWSVKRSLCFLQLCNG